MYLIPSVWKVTLNLGIKTLNRNGAIVVIGLFGQERKSNGVEFSKELSSLSDIYVNDAFSVSPRKHASTYGAPKLFDAKLSGLNLKKEIEYLSNVRDNPIKPFILVIGGIKNKGQDWSTGKIYFPKRIKSCWAVAHRIHFLKHQELL